MSHTITLTEWIDIIHTSSGDYDLEEWSDITGISCEDLIKSATSVTDLTEQSSFKGYTGIDNDGNPFHTYDFEESIGE